MVQGMVYKITCPQDPRIYVGSTRQTLAQRMADHRKDSIKERCKNQPIYQAFAQYGRHNFDITLLELVEFTVYEELRAREKYWQATLNTLDPSVGWNLKAARTTKEEATIQQNQYNEKNRDKILQLHRDYHRKNRERLLEKQKIYKASNKEACRNRDLAYYYKNQQEIIQKRREYRRNHSDLVRKSREKYYAKNRDKILEQEKRQIECPECKEKMAASNWGRHIKTEKHLAHLL